MDDGHRSVYDADFFVAWEKLADQIKFSFQAAESEAESRPLATQQVRYVLANISIAYFLDEIGQGDLAAHFHFLAEAMNDLVDGIPHPLFKVEAPSKRGRQPDTSAIWRIRSTVCIGIEFLIAGGMSDDGAIQFVAKKHKKELASLLRPNADLKSSIKTWLKSFANDDVRNEVALSSYKQEAAHLETLRLKYTGDQIRGVGEHLVAKAAERASSLVKI